VSVCLFFSQGGQLVGFMPVLAACHLIMYFQLCCIVFLFMLWQIKFSLSSADTCTAVNAKHTVSSK